GRWIVERVDVEQQVSGRVRTGGRLPVPGRDVAQRRPYLTGPDARVRRDVQRHGTGDRGGRHGGAGHQRPFAMKERGQDAFSGRDDVDILAVVAEVTIRIVGVRGVPGA